MDGPTNNAGEEAVASSSSHAVEPASLVSMVDDAVAAVSGIAGAAGVTLATDLAPGSLCVLCERARVVRDLTEALGYSTARATAGETVTVTATVVGEAVFAQVSGGGSSDGACFELRAVGGCGE